MIRILVLLYISLLVCGGLQSQSSVLLPAANRFSDVYPVRVNHKLGYIKIYNMPQGPVFHFIIDPVYDHVMEENLPYNGADPESEERSPYRLFELDARVGLLDASVREVLPARYHRIRVVSAVFFAVEEHEGEGFQLIDSTGRTYWEGRRFEDIRRAYTQDAPTAPAHFFIRKNKRWGLMALDGRRLIPTEYADIGQSETVGYFKVKSPGTVKGWQVTDTAGNWLVSSMHEDIRVFSPHFIVGFGGEKWNVLHKKSGAIYTPGGLNYQHAEKLNDSLALLVTVKLPSDSVVLFSTADPPRALLSLPVPIEEGESAGAVEDAKDRNWIIPIDDRHVAQVQNRRAYALLNNKGRRISPVFDELSPSGLPNVYKVLDDRQWGLWLTAGKDTLLLPCMYSSISDFNGRIATLRMGTKFGAVAFDDGKISTLPCIYDQIAPLQDNADSFRVQHKGTVIVMTYSPETGFQPQRADAGAMLVSGNKAGRFKEAVPMNKVQLPPYWPVVSDINLKINATEDGFSLSRTAGYKPKTSAGKSVPGHYHIQLSGSMKPFRAVETIENEVVAVFYRDTGFQSPFVIHNTPAKAEVRFYTNASSEQDTYIIGFRPFDSIYPLTTFIDSAGMMGLINRKGDQLTVNGQAPRYTYIGPFMAGRARVCMGGRLVVDEGNKLQEPSKFILAKHDELLSEFQLYPTVNLSKSLAAAPVYAVSTPESPVRWGYIDIAGKLVIQTDADFVANYHWLDSTAYFLRKNKRIIVGKPDADYGIINHAGKVIAEAQYSSVSNHADYFLVSADSTPTFFFTSKGVELFVNPTRLRGFSEGLAHYFDAETKLWGYLDTLGNTAIPPRFLKARPFSEGRALVADEQGQCMFINHSGGTVFTTDLPVQAHHFIGDFKNGRCWFKDKGWAWGAYDPGGNVAIQPTFFYQPKGASPSFDSLHPLPMDFSHGKAVAATFVQGKPVYHLIDTLGNIQSSHANMQHISPFDEYGLAVCTDLMGRKGLLNSRGEIACTPAYSEIRSFYNGYAKVKSTVGKWGLINTQGRVVIPCVYAAIDTISEGLVAVKKYETDLMWYLMDTSHVQIWKEGFKKTAPFLHGVTAITKLNGHNIAVDRQGEPIDQLRYASILFYSGGLFGVQRKSQGMFYADASGDNVFNRHFREIHPFAHGVAKVKRMTPNPKSEGYGAINKRGVMIVPTKFNTLHIQPNGNIITNPQRYFGLLDKNGNVLIPLLYDRIEQYADSSIFRVERGEAIGYIHIANGKTSWVFDLQR